MRITSYYKQFFSENKPWFLGVTFLFLVSSILGGVAFYQYPELLEYFSQTIKDIVGNTEGLDLLWVIFRQNVIASLVAALGGIVAGLAPFLVSTFNGFLLGFIGTAVVVEGGGGTFTNLLYIVLAITPHGIIEIPIILLASAVGMRLGLNWVIKEIKDGSGWATFKRDLWNACGAVPVIILGLMIAAVIEVYVTGHILESMF